MSRLPFLVAALTGLFLGGDVWAAAPETLPFADVRPGMTGEGRTVFSGTTVEPFDVEILATIPDFGPDQDLILARCSGGPLADTRILSGMSGSPVFIDGKLIGAVAYSWGFATEAIAGITPIGEMLAIGATPTATQSSLRPDASWALALAEPEARLAFLTGLGDSFRTAQGSATRLEVPLAVAGLGARGTARVAEDLRATGLLPVQVGGSGRGASPAPPLEPGSPVGIKLVRGDIEMTATGTVTWVDGNRVLAFGHPLFGLGSVDLPMTAADVRLLMPSLQQSSRLAVPTEPVGALRQDRASGVLGRLGAEPSMIPVRLQLEGSEGEVRNYSFDIAEDSLLSPLLLFTSLNGILAANERPYGDATLRLLEGSVIRIDGSDDVELDNVFVGSEARATGTSLPAYALHLLLNNGWTPARVSGINLRLSHVPTARVASLQRATVDRYRVRPGESFEAHVRIQDYRGPERELTFELQLPEDTPPGPIRLHFGNAGTVSRAARGREPILPRNLDQLIRLINKLRRNDFVYVLATREEAAVVLDGALLPRLPPTVTALLTPVSRSGRRGNTTLRQIFEDAVPTGTAVEGFASIEMEVLAP